MSIFPDKKTNQPTGFALGSIEGRVAIHYVNPANPKDNFTFKCHRSNGSTNGMQDIYAVSHWGGKILNLPCHPYLSFFNSETLYNSLSTQLTLLETICKGDQQIAKFAIRERRVIVRFYNKYVKIYNY